MAQEITIPTDDGTARAFHFAPPAPTTRGVIVYQDMFGIRPALFAVCARLASLGYIVLLPDLYYRHGAYGPFPADETIGVPERFEPIRAIRDATPVGLTLRDALHFVSAISDLGARGGLGVLGYCLGGGRALRTADLLPGRIAAAASIHGGRLAIDDPESPHRHLDRTTARLYVGSAGEDPSFPPEQSALLIETLRAKGIDHQFENYAGCAHGWAIPDNPIFDMAGSERHWRRLETLFAETVGH